MNFHFVSEAFLWGMAFAVQLAVISYGSERLSIARDKYWLFGIALVIQLAFLFYGGFIC